MIEYRHNVMKISSLDTFLNIKGGFHQNKRDVYFVRTIGETAEFNKKISEIDRKMDKEMSSGRLKYARWRRLPPLHNVDDINLYARVYDEWHTKGTLSLKNLKKKDLLEHVANGALPLVIAQYKKGRGHSSKSMEKNFAVKILYWLDGYAQDVFSDWNETCCIKIIAENIIKEQEYLFFYFLTLLGCDVMIIENKKDAEVGEELKLLSHKIELGAFGSCEFEEYTPCVVSNSDKPKKNSPERPVIHMNPAEKKGVPLREKSFEELAKLASSVVMIAICDRKGDIIGTGSGIMIGKAGYILTNNHVASGGSFYSVRIEDDDTMYRTDEVIKYNPALDLAIIRIDRKLSPIPIYKGEKKLARGQRVVAIGSPLGLFNSVSDGIISGFRSMRDVDMIQFTAPISHGSSGGAVLNMYGEVIGISTAGIDDGQNINLAVGYEDIQMFTRGFVNNV